MRPETLTWWGIGSLGLALALAIVVQFVPWYTMTQTFEDEGYFGGIQATNDLKLWKIESEQGSADWSDPDADEGPGIAELRAAGPLVVTGTILAFVAIGLIVASRFVDVRFMDLGGAGAAALGAILLMVGLIVYTVGAGALLDDIETGSGFAGYDSESSAAIGLFLAIGMVVGAVAGAALTAAPVVKGLVQK